MLTLLTTDGHHGQATFHEVAPGRAPGADQLFPPDDSKASGAFGGIVPLDRNHRHQAAGQNAVERCTGGQILKSHDRVDLRCQ